MPHPSQGNISNCPVILSRNKVHNPPVPCPTYTSKHEQHCLLHHGTSWAWRMSQYCICEERPGETKRRPCSARHVLQVLQSHSWRWACAWIHLCAHAQTLLEVRRAGGLSLPPPACDNPQGCAACWWMCVYIFFFFSPFVLFIAFNPLGHISELKNFRADIAF